MNVHNQKVMDIGKKPENYASISLTGYRSIPSKIIAKIRSFNGPENSVKNAKNMPCS